MNPTSRTASQQVREALDRIRETRESLNAFLSTRDEEAAAEAAASDRRSAGGEQEPLAGVPLAVKDNIMVAGSPATAGSRMLGDYVPSWDATVVRRLGEAGAIVVGKTNLDEFAMGSDNSTSYYGPVSNPLDESRVPGGSSGGSAAAVAAGLVPLALGTDTGGSVRQPASFCGIIGFKPGYGRVSRHGVIALAGSLDHVGFFARDPELLKAAWRAAAGPDELDATTAAAAAVPLRPAPETLAGLRVGVISGLAGERNSEGVRAALARTVELLGEAGLETGTTDIPSLRFTAPAYFVINCVEAASSLARYDGMTFGRRAGADALGQEAVTALSRAEGFGREVKRRILFGTWALNGKNRARSYGRALQARALLQQETAAALEEFDVLLSPTSPLVAWEKDSTDPLQMRRHEGGTNLANLTGLPAISLPGATAEHGLPVGMQFMARPGAEELLLSLSALFA